MKKTSCGGCSHLSAIATRFLNEFAAEMMRVNVFDYEWRRQVHVGDQVDAQNTFGNWCPARVVQVVNGEVLLQFLNMHESWRQWLPLDSGRLAQTGTKVH
jgi:hypothetical protein